MLISLCEARKAFEALAACCVLALCCAQGRPLRCSLATGQGDTYVSRFTLYVTRWCTAERDPEFANKVIEKLGKNTKIMLVRLLPVASCASQRTVHVRLCQNDGCKLHRSGLEHAKTSLVGLAFW